MASKCQEIDNTGTSLWNICTRLRREYDLDKPQDVPTILLMARVFAFLLLGCAHESGKSEASNAVRVMKIGIKAAKNCIGRRCWLEGMPLLTYYVETKQVELALKVLEKLGAYELSLKPPDLERPAKDGEAQEGQRLVAEYYVLRTALVICGPSTLSAASLIIDFRHGTKGSLTWQSICSRNQFHRSSSSIPIQQKVLQMSFTRWGKIF